MYFRVCDRKLSSQSFVAVFSLFSPFIYVWVRCKYIILTWEGMSVHLQIHYCVHPYSSLSREMDMWNLAIQTKSILLNNRFYVALCALIVLNILMMGLPMFSLFVAIDRVKMSFSYVPNVAQRLLVNSHITYSSCAIDLFL